MFSFLLEKEPSEEKIPEVVEDEEEEEEDEEPEFDEEKIFFTEEISECFALFDKNNSGSFDIKYLNKALKGLGIFLTPSEIKELTNVMNTNGMIPFEKFLEYSIVKLQERSPIDALRLSFQAFDPDKEGVLPSDRLKRWLMTLGDPLTEKEAKEVIKLGDPAGKGVIEYDELAVILLKN